MPINKTLLALQDQHREISEIANLVEGMLNPEQLSVGPIAKVAHMLICDLCEKVELHLAEEHHGLYPTLLSHGDQNTQNMVWGLINNDRPLKIEFSTYNRRWLKDCEFDFTEAFLKDTKDMLEILGGRLELERNSLMPRLVEISNAEQK